MFDTMEHMIRNPSSFEDITPLTPLWTGVNWSIQFVLFIFVSLPLAELHTTAFNKYLVFEGLSECNNGQV